MKKTKESTLSYAARHDHKMNSSGEKSPLTRTRLIHSPNDSDRSSLTLKTPSPLIGKDSPSLNRSQPFQGQNESLDINKSPLQSHIPQKSFNRDQHISCSNSITTDQESTPITTRKEATDASSHLLRDQVLSRKLALPSLRSENSLEDFFERSSSPTNLQRHDGEMYIIDETLSPPNDESVADHETTTNLKMIFDGKPYAIASAPNDITPRIKENENRSTKTTPNGSMIDSSKPKNNISWSIDRKRENPETQAIVLKEFRLLNGSTERISHEISQVNDLNAFLDDQIIFPSHKDKIRYKELIAVDRDVYHHQSNVSTRGIAKKTLEEKYMFHNDEIPDTEHNLKRYLSVIFSTGKSMDASVDSEDSRIEDKSVVDQNDTENQEGMTSRQREIETIKEESITNETEKMPASPPVVIEMKKFAQSKEGQADSSGKDVCATKANTSSNTEEETFASVIQCIRLQNKENKGLDENLSKLLVKLKDIYGKQTDKYEEKLKLQTEKCERYREANQTLLNMIKSWEKEIDQLAATNKNLHDIIVGLEEKGFQAEHREAELSLASSELKLKLQNLKAQSAKDSTELQELKAQQIKKEKEMSSLVTYARRCEDLVQTISDGLKPLVTEIADKVSLDHLKRFLDRVENKTSKVASEFGETPRFKSIKEITLELNKKEKLLTSPEAPRTHYNDALKTLPLESVDETDSSFDNQYDSLKKFNSVDLRPKASQTNPMRPACNQKTKQLCSSTEGIVTTPQLDKLNSRKLFSPTCKSVFDLKNKFSALHSPFIKKKANYSQRSYTEEKKLNNSTLSTRVENEPEKSPEKEDIMSKIYDRQRDKSAPEKKDATKIKARKNQI